MVISVDPGYTSGTCLAAGFDGDGEVLLTSCMLVAWSERFIYADLIQTHGKAISAIIVERFRLTADPVKLRSQERSEMPSSRVIGLIEAAAYSAGILDRIVFQDPRDRRQVTIPPRHYAIIGDSDHNKDAYRHMRYYGRTHRIII